MNKTTLIGICILSLPGCAGVVASIDADAALKVAADANMKNIKIMVASRAADWGKDITTAEARFQADLATARDGADAVGKYAKFKTAMVRMESMKAADGENSQKVLNTAAWITAIVDRRIALRARWDNLIGRLPAISQIKTLAEAEIREYMNTLNKGSLNKGAGND